MSSSSRMLNLHPWKNVSASLAKGENIFFSKEIYSDNQFVIYCFSKFLNKHEIIYEKSFYEVLCSNISILFNIFDLKLLFNKISLYIIIILIYLYLIIIFILY